MTRKAAIALMVLLLFLAAVATFLAWTAANALPLVAAVVFLGAGLLMSTQTRQPHRPGGPD